MKGNKLAAGKQGEDKAAAYLKEKGFEILEMNYRHRRGEIDVIAQKDNLLIFVEVKMRSKVSFGNPEEAVGVRKSAMVMMAAESYIFKIDWKLAVRFDVISITGKEEIIHFEDAFG